LAKWLAQKDDLLAGRSPRMINQGLTMADLLQQVPNLQKMLVASGELSARSWGDCYSTCETVIAVFGRNRSV
jgi:hypothetical protein